MAVEGVGLGKSTVCLAGTISCNRKNQCWLSSHCLFSFQEQV